MIVINDASESLASFNQWEQPPMPTQKTLKPSKAKEPTIEDQQAAWLKRLDELIGRIQGWAAELDWSTRRIEKQMKDSEVGRYVAPALMLQDETVRILLEPIARSAPGAEGVVDLYLMPGLDDLASLYYSDGKWQLHYMWPGIPSVSTMRDAEPKTLSKAVLQQLLSEMKRNAANI